MDKEIIIKNEESGIAVAYLEDGKLVEILDEHFSLQRLAGGIYKGKVENVLPGMQAAFVNLGMKKNSFLYVEDALPHRSYVEGEQHEVKPINEVLSPGQEVVVQIVKEATETKGARVTTHISLPGRYLVFLPTGNYTAISRRIEDEEEIARLKSLMEELLSPGMGVIIRTVASGISKEDLAAELKMLQKLWRRIQGKAVKSSAPSLIYRDSDLLQRVVRDANASEINKIIVDNTELKERLIELVNLNNPELASKISYKYEKDIFETYNIYNQTEQALKRKVWLKSGGYIVFDQVEALTIVDVNTGKYVGETNLMDTVYKTNMEAAIEVCRQLRLRNTGGIILIDFIDMDSAEKRNNILSALEEEFKKDRTRITLLGMTQLGLVEMTRKKSGHALSYALEKECPFCGGKGRVLSEEAVADKIYREVDRVAESTDADTIFIEANPSIIAYLFNSDNKNFNYLEKKVNKKIVLRGKAGTLMEDIVVRPLYEKMHKAAISTLDIGQELMLYLEESCHEDNCNAISHYGGLVIRIEDGANMIGNMVKVIISDVNPAFAKAKIVD